MNLSILKEAHTEWASRPLDQTYETLEELRTATHNQRLRSRESKPVPFAKLRVEADGPRLFLQGSRKGALTHFAFGQLAAHAGAPAHYLRALPASLAMQNLNHGLKHRSETASSNALMLLEEPPSRDDALTIRAVTTEVYSRIWNDDCTAGLVRLGERGWRVPPALPGPRRDPRTRPATEADLLPNQGQYGIQIQVGDLIAPAGLYASAHDMFAFLVHPERVISAGRRALMRGFFMRNSEVGDGALWITVFLFDGVCGNHYCYGVDAVQELRVRHTSAKALAEALATWSMRLGVYERNASTEERAIRAAQAKELGKDKATTVAELYGLSKRKNLSTLTKVRLERAYDVAARHEDRDGPPTTLWGMIAGLTQVSQESGHTDQRTLIDAQTGRLMGLIIDV